MAVGFGGDTLNSAIYCARAAQGHDVKVHYVSPVGHDVLSQGALDLLEREGVTTSHVTHDTSRQIGIYTIQKDAQGDRSFHYWRDNSVTKQMFSDDHSPHLAAIETAISSIFRVLRKPNLMALRLSLKRFSICLCLCL